MPYQSSASGSLLGGWPSFSPELPKNKSQIVQVATATVTLLFVNQKKSLFFDTLYFQILENCHYRFFFLRTRYFTASWQEIVTINMQTYFSDVNGAPQRCTKHNLRGCMLRPCRQLYPRKSCLQTSDIKTSHIEIYKYSF